MKHTNSRARATLTKKCRLFVGKNAIGLPFKITTSVHTNKLYKLGLGFEFQMRAISGSLFRKANILQDELKGCIDPAILDGKIPQIPATVRWNTIYGYMM